MRVFYDANVILSIVAWPGRTIRVHRALVAAGHVPVTSRRVLGEVDGVLERKLPGLTAERRAEIRAILEEEWLCVPSIEKTASVSLRDPDDEGVLADAEAARCPVLLTGDRDLLDAAGRIETLRVLSVREIAAEHL